MAQSVKSLSGKHEDLVQAPASMSSTVTSVLKKEKEGFLGLAGQSV